VDPAALRAGGTAFLTRALRASGALAADNAVTRISGLQEVPGGSTGRKADELHDQLMLYVGIMAVAWLLDVPALIRSRFGDSARSLRRTDPPIKEDESVRARLQMLTNALSLWETRHFGDLLDAMLA